jgi:predicted Zn-dependent protease
MPLDVAAMRKLVALDPKDPLSRFALATKLLESSPDDATVAEAAEHLRFANAADPAHLATYHLLAQSLVRLGRRDEARPVLEEGIRRVTAAGGGMGRDLGPAMEQMLRDL